MQNSSKQKTKGDWLPVVFHHPHVLPLCFLVCWCATPSFQKFWTAFRRIISWHVYDWRPSFLRPISCFGSRLWNHSKDYDQLVQPELSKTILLLESSKIGELTRRALIYCWFSTNDDQWNSKVYIRTKQSICLASFIRYVGWFLAHWSKRVTLCCASLRKQSCRGMFNWVLQNSLYLNYLLRG